MAAPTAQVNGHAAGRAVTGRVALVAGYIAAYVALDWVSYIYPIAPLGITPWNPPPGLSPHCCSVTV